MDNKQKSITSLSSPEIAERISQLKDIGNNPAYHLNKFQEIKVNIRPNPSIAPALFRPDPLIPGGYTAHPLTIQAMRKDIFLAGNHLEELSQEYICERCHHSLDLQYWLFCPYCEASFKIK